MDNSSWHESSIAARAKFGVSPNYKPWTDSAPPKRLTGMPLTPRVRELVNILWISRPSSRRTLPWYTDVSQDVARQPWSSTPPCLTTSSLVYNHGQDEVWSTAARFALQGLPAQELGLLSGRDCLLSPHEQADLIGEAMFAPSVPAIIMSVFLCGSAPWWNPDTSEGRDGSVSS